MVTFLHRSQLKKFLGSKVRRTVGKARLMAQEVSLPGRQKEEMIDIPDELTGGEQHVKVFFLPLRDLTQMRSTADLVVVLFL